MAGLGRLPLAPRTLDLKLTGSGDYKVRLAAWLGGDTAAFTALTVGDLLYDAFRIDPVAIEGFDLARAADLGDILTLSRFAEQLGGLTGLAQTGNLAQLHGYVAECIVAHALVADGVDVAFPETSNEPGWDLLVNGDRFQVKCMASPGGVRDHLAHYPDIPVIANRELAGDFVGDDRVTILEVLGHDLVVEQTRETLDAAAGLLDLRTPLITGAICSVRAAVAVLRGDSDLYSASYSAAFSALARGTGAATVAAVAALGVTGGWIAIIAPVAGSILGYSGGRKLANGVIRHAFCRDEAATLIAATQDLAGAAYRVLARMKASSLRFRDRVAVIDDGPPGSFAASLKADWLKRIDLELDRRSYYQDQLAIAAREPRTIDRSSDDPRVHAARAMWVAAKAGILPANIRSETSALRDSMNAYDRALKRWLWRR